MDHLFGRCGVLIVATCLSAGAAAQARAAVSGQRLGVFFAPGQKPYACTVPTIGQIVLNPCPPSIPVYAWKIPDISGGYSGCVAALPYKSITVASPGNKSVTLTWILDNGGVTDLVFIKLVEGKAVEGIDIQPSDIGTPVNTVYSNAMTTDTKVSWNLSLKPTDKYAFRHVPMVGYPNPAIKGEFLPCTAVDPIIINNAD